MKQIMEFLERYCDGQYMVGNGMITVDLATAHELRQLLKIADENKVPFLLDRKGIEFRGV